MRLGLLAHGMTAQPDPLVEPVPAMVSQQVQQAQARDGRGDAAEAERRACLEGGGVPVPLHRRPFGITTAPCGRTATGFRPYPTAWTMRR